MDTRVPIIKAVANAVAVFALLPATLVIGAVGLVVVIHFLNEGEPAAGLRREADATMPATSQPSVQASTPVRPVLRAAHSVRAPRLIRGTSSRENRRVSF